MQCSRVHYILFSLVLFNAAATGYTLATRDSSLLEWMVIVIFFFSIGTLLYQRKKDFGKSVKRMTWAALAYIVVGSLGTFVYGLTVFVRNGGANGPVTHEEMIPVHDSLYVALSGLSILLALTVGLLGFSALKKNGTVSLKDE